MDAKLFETSMFNVPPAAIVIVTPAPPVIVLAFFVAPDAIVWVWPNAEPTQKQPATNKTIANAATLKAAAEVFEFKPVSPLKPERRNLFIKIINQKPMIQF
jgi:hypothetical protein